MVPPELGEHIIRNNHRHVKCYHRRDGLGRGQNVPRREPTPMVRPDRALLQRNGILQSAQQFRPALILTRMSHLFATAFGCIRRAAVASVLLNLTT
jgi:hypothetical protein